MLRISLQLGKASQNRPVLDPEDLELLPVAGAAGPPDDVLNVANRLSRKRFVGEAPHRPQTLQKPNELVGLRGLRHGFDGRPRRQSAGVISQCSCEAIWRAGSGEIAFRSGDP